MAQSTQRPGEMITSINVTPLVDVVLVLLVVLMVTSAYIASETLPLDLPRGSTGESSATTLAISIDRSGTLYLDGEPTDVASLRSNIVGDANTRAVIAADGETPHRRVVEIIDLLRGRGVSKYAIQIQPDERAR